jgi:hypothetical protein
VVQEALKGGRCIANTKGHHQKLVMTIMSVENRFGNIDFLHANMVLLEQRSSLVKNYVPCSSISSVKRSSMIGMGNLSLTIKLSRARKIRTHAPSAFFFKDHDN